MYFSGLDGAGDALVFLDPDNGFEPQRSCTDKHVRYGEVSRVIEQLSADSVVSVFQHFRRVPFPEDFARIRRRLGSLRFHGRLLARPDVRRRGGLGPDDPAGGGGEPGLRAAIPNLCDALTVPVPESGRNRNFDSI